MSKELITAKVTTVVVCVLNICCVVDIVAYYYLDRPPSVYLLGWVVGVLLSSLIMFIRRWGNLKELEEIQDD